MGRALAIAVTVHSISLAPSASKLHQRHCERSEAIQLSTVCGMDCFVASAPRNDVDGLVHKAISKSRSPSIACEIRAGLTRLCQRRLLCMGLFSIFWFGGHRADPAPVPITG